MTRECERCGVIEGSEEYPFELGCIDGEMLCEDCQDDVVSKDGEQ